MLDDQLNYIMEIGREGSGDGEFNGPVEVTFDNKGNIVVADSSNNTIQFFKLTGEFIKKIGSVGQGDGQFHKPTGVFVDENNRLLCATRMEFRFLTVKGIFKSN